MGHALRQPSELSPCDIVDHLQGSFGPFGPKSKESLEKGSRTSRLRGAEKVRKKVENRVKNLKKT